MLTIIGIIIFALWFLGVVTPKDDPGLTQSFKYSFPVKPHRVDELQKLDPQSDTDRQPSSK